MANATNLYLSNIDKNLNIGFMYTLYEKKNIYCFVDMNFNRILSLSEIAKNYKIQTKDLLKIPKIPELQEGCTVTTIKHTLTLYVQDLYYLRKLMDYIHAMSSNDFRYIKKWGDGDEINKVTNNAI